MSADEGLPLTCMARGGVIDMFIGTKPLRFAAEQHPAFWDGVSGKDGPNVVITSLPKFAAAVVEQLNKEDPDNGSTMLSRMLDQAIKLAVESGCEGVEHGPA